MPKEAGNGLSKHPRETDTQFQKRVDEILTRGQGFPPFDPINVSVVRSQSIAQPKVVGVRGNSSDEEKQCKPHELNELRRDFPPFESVSKVKLRYNNVQIIITKSASVYFS